ncbi:MAG TPA: nuclear transport factor 2 family protein [Chthoniobacteraceae bacterium]|nr:nuclear transport factor 2 family protein [Chthoniobacteraceae bacterium]
METQTEVLTNLYTCLANHDYEGMEKCYHPDATFRDIGFTLEKRTPIRAMWHLISETDLRASFKIVDGEGSPSTVDLIDEYTFPPTGKRVRNPIRSVFEFKEGLIFKHRDFCDTRQWCIDAWGPLLGLLFWLLPFLQRALTMSQYHSWVKRHSEYAKPNPKNAAS